MPGFNNGVMYADNVRFDGLGYPGEVTADGQLLIGSTAAPHIKVGSLTSTGSTIAVTPGSGTINLEAGATVPTTFTEDSGTASPALNNINVQGGTSSGGAATNINTVGAGSTVTVCLNNSISQPNTNSTATTGMYSLGGLPFLHNYSSLGERDNIFLGPSAGNLTNGSAQNIGIGALALQNVTTGDYNVCIGQDAGQSLTTAINNCYIGTNAGTNATGSFNVGIGTQAILAGSSSNNVCVGFGASNSLTTGGDNTSIGYGAGQFLTSGGSCTYVGREAGHLASTGFNNTGIGENSLLTLVTGANNTCLGQSSGSAYNAAESSNVLISNVGVNGESNAIHIGTQGNGAGQQNTCYVAGIVGVTTANSQLVTINSSTGQLGVQTLANLPTWTVINANQTAAVGNGYFCNKAGLLALALPATSAVGDIIEVANINTALGITITQGANQEIFVGNTHTTNGVTGSLSSTALGDTLKLVCRTANLEWQVVSMIGSWTPA